MCREFDAKMHLDTQNIKQCWYWASVLEFLLIAHAHLTNRGYTNSFTHTWYPEHWHLSSHSCLTNISWLRSERRVAQQAASRQLDCIQHSLCVWNSRSRRLFKFLHIILPVGCGWSTIQTIITVCCNYKKSIASEYFAFKLTTTWWGAWVRPVVSDTLPQPQCGQYTFQVWLIAFFFCLSETGIFWTSLIIITKYIL